MTETQTQSHWLRNITIIIIVGLLIWQYAVPYIDPDIKIPSEYISDWLIAPDTTESSFYMIVTDRTTGLTTIIDGLTPDNDRIIVMQEYHTYSVGIGTDAPGSVLGVYTWLTNINWYNASSELYEDFPFGTQIPAYQLFLLSTFTLSDDSIFFSYNQYYGITCQLTGTEGEYIQVRNSPISATQISIYMEYPGFTP
jgi:hypothetical protein